MARRHRAFGTVTHPGPVAVADAPLLDHVATDHATPETPHTHQEDTTMATPNDALATTPPASNGTTALATVPPGIPIEPEEWAAMSEAERAGVMALFASEMQETMKDLTPEFPKITTPTSGGKHWTLPNGDPVKEFEGVVVAHFKARVYWPIDAPMANNPPACSSVDGRYPISGKGPTGAVQCAACPHAQFGTGKEQRGQACKERLNVFVLFPGSEIPTLLSLPPTGIRPFSRYAVSLLNTKPVRPLSSVTTIFALETKKGAGPEYSVVAPKIGRTLTFTEMRAAVAMRERFKDAMSRRGIVEADVADVVDEPGAHDTEY